jgi:type I restriction enzyme S subunit
MSEDQGDWQRRSIRSLTVHVSLVNPSVQPDQIFTYVDISAVDNKTQTIANPRKVFGRDAPSRARQPIEDRDVLFSNVRTYLRNVAQVIEIEQPALASTGFTVLRANSEADPRYLFHLVRSRYFLSLIAGSDSGTLFPATSSPKVRAAEAPVPSRDIQAEIASSIDRLEGVRQRALSELEDAETSVSNILSSAVIQACTGALTQQWRREHLGIIDEPAVLNQPEGSSQEAPLVYQRLSLNACTISIKYGTSQRSDEDRTGIPMLRMGNIQNGELDWSDLKYLPRDSVDESLLLEDGDVLFNRTNSAELVGKTAVFHGTREATYASYLLCIKVNRDVLHPDWLSTWLNSSFGREWAAEVRTAGANQANINATKLGQLRLPVPHYEEQEEILRRLAVIREAAKAATHRIGEARRLIVATMEAILDRAVGGPGLASQGDTMEDGSLRGSASQPASQDRLGPIPWTDVSRRRRARKADESEDGGRTELADMVAAAGGRIEVGQLWQESAYWDDIDHFYSELRRQIADGTLDESRNTDGFASIESRQP